jgi:predicted O-methyltransferase YrrM
MRKPNSLNDSTPSTSYFWEVIAASFADLKNEREDVYLFNDTPQPLHIQSTIMASTDGTIVQPDIEQYLKDIAPDRDRVLTEMETFAEQIGFPIVGPLVGRLLYLLAASMNAKRILELGSGFGYSAYWFAKATSDDARIICTDNKHENAERARAWFARGNVDKKIEFRVGDALATLAATEGPFDIIFNDIDKHDYPKALALSLPKLRTGGLLISDNVLWKGRVLAEKPDEATAAILTFNRRLYSLPELFSTIIPLRDGVSVSIKL